MNMIARDHECGEFFFFWGDVQYGSRSQQLYLMP